LTHVDGAEIIMTAAAAGPACLPATTRQSPGSPPPRPTGAFPFQISKSTLPGAGRLLLLPQPPQMSGSTAKTGFAGAAGQTFVFSEKEGETPLKRTLDSFSLFWSIVIAYLRISRHFCFLYPPERRRTIRGERPSGLNFTAKSENGP